MPDRLRHHEHADQHLRYLQSLYSLVILSNTSVWMFHSRGGDQLSRGTASAHSTSRWINQLVFQLSPSISGNNLEDIIKLPFYLSRGQGALFLFSASTAPLIVGTGVD